MKKIVYMHMAKTAGSSVNQFFAQSLGKENCLDHIERFTPVERAEHLRSKAFVSGHIYSGDVFQLLQDHADTYLFTFMREPIRQIASHILWLDHYNEAEYRSEFERLGEPLRQLVKAIRAVDFDSANDLDDLMTNLSPWGLRMLDNMQTRYMCGDKRPIPLSLSHASVAYRIAARFDRIGFVEDMDAFLSTIAHDVGLKMRDNAAPKVNEAKSSRRIDLSKPLIRRVLSKRIVADDRLYSLLRHRAATSVATNETDVDPSGERDPNGSTSVEAA